MNAKSIFGLLLALLPATAFAQDPAAVPAGQAAPSVVDIQISQPVVSKKFGAITLPFSWAVEETNERLIATEKFTDFPAVFAIDLYKYPAVMPEKEVIDAIAHSFAEELGAQEVVSSHSEKLDCGKKKCPEIVYYTMELEGVEKGAQRKCALEMIPSKGQVVTLSICAEASVKYSMTLPEILHQIFKHMK